MSPAWRVAEARRITGVHPLLDGPGVACELGVEDEAAVAEAVARVGDLWARLGLGDAASTRVRRHAGGVSLGARAPADVLHAAVAALEAALGEEEVDVGALLDTMQREADPALRSLLAETAGLPVFWDEDGGFTAGMGRHARTWALDALPTVEAVRAAATRIPTAIVTGTNGKTTTTRMLASIARAAGHVAGNTSSDGVVVDGAWDERGDWTGPGAARAVLRHPRVTLAVLETARGGLLRRGLAFAGVDAAGVTNVSPDHLGEWGLHDLADMAWAKLGVAAGVRPGGTLVLNGRDPGLAAARLDRSDLRVRRFADGPAAPDLDAWATGGALWIREDGDAVRILGDDEIPLTLGGAARFMVENALCATLLARALSLPLDAVRAGLRDLKATAGDSLGRLNAYRMPSGARVVVDFAHNAAGAEALQGVAAAARPGRVVTLASQAGDRSDALMALYAEAIAGMRPDVVILKELPDHLRGRALGETPALLRRRMVGFGVPDAAILDIPDEVEAAAHALTLVGDGDLALLLVHEQLDAVLRLVEEAGGVPEGG